MRDRFTDRVSCNARYSRGEVSRYESSFLLCYLRGPAGIIIALAEQIG